MSDEDLKSVLLKMTEEIYKTFHLLADETKELRKRIEKLEKLKR